MRSWAFFLVALAVGAAFFVAALALGNDYAYFAGYVVLQFIVLATAWNILGGYCGYVNFGSAAFFAIGTYTTVALQKVGANSGRFLSGTFAVQSTCVLRSVSVSVLSRRSRGSDCSAPGFCQVPRHWPCAERSTDWKAR